MKTRSAREMNYWFFIDIHLNRPIFTITVTVFPNSYLAGRSPLRHLRKWIIRPNSMRDGVERPVSVCL